MESQSIELLKKYPLIQAYLKYTENQESPVCFHIWTLIGCVSLVASRRVYIDRGHYKLYPNFFIVLVSDSALCRKSTALNIGIKLINEVKKRLKKMALDAGIPSIVTGKITTEALFKSMSEEGLGIVNNAETKTDTGHTSRPLVILSLEFGTFISRPAQISGLVEILTDMFDCPDFREYPTKTSGIDDVYDAYLSIFGATTPKWMQRQLTSEVLSEGFIGRCMIVFSNTPARRSPRPEVTEEQEQAKEIVIKRLLNLSICSGELTLSSSASKAFDEWYMTRPEIPEDTTLDGGFHNREHDHLLKLAGCLALSNDSLTIELQDIETALVLIEDLKMFKKSVFYGAIFEHEFPQMKFVEEALRMSSDWITRSELVGHVYKKVSIEQLNSCIETLLESEKIEHKVEKLSKKGRPTTFYKWRK